MLSHRTRLGPRRPGTRAPGPCRGARGGGPLFTTSPWSAAWADRSGLAGGLPRAGPTSRVGHLAAHPGPSHQTLRRNQPGGLHEDALPQACDGESGQERRDRRSRPGTHGPPRGPPPPWNHPPGRSGPRPSSGASCCPPLSALQPSHLQMPRRHSWARPAPPTCLHTLPGHSLVHEPSTHPDHPLPSPRSTAPCLHHSLPRACVCLSVPTSPPRRRTVGSHSVRLAREELSRDERK